MCGLCGIINYEKERIVKNDDLKQMANSIRHRGPDDEGYYINGNIGLAFRRLSIIDLNNGNQPLSNLNESIYIVFNGEIYNFLELRKILVHKGYIFKTQTDTEVILHLYEEYGVDCLKFLRGMFAFAIWDNNKQQLFCARDRFGIKPFYYYTDNNKFVFGSEIKAILKCQDIDKTLSYDGLDSYFAFGYITSDLSIYKNIKKLQPGNYLLLSFNRKVNLNIRKYWEISFEPDYSKTENQWSEEIESILSETIKLHMIADVPIGAFLSGGVDSSSVVAMMAKHSKIPVKTFSIGFKEEKFNELKFAREVANKYNCEHHEQIVEPESIGLLPKLVNAYDEPFADPSAIPTYYVSKLARESVKVILSGDGGDELFAGYDSYMKFKNLYNFPLNFNNSYLNKFIWGKIHNLVPQDVKGKGILYFMSQNKEYLGAYLNLWTKEERQKLITSDNGYPIESYKIGILKNGRNNDFISNLQNLDMKTYMVDDILTKVDRMSMLCSLEVRVPLLDHKFAELSFRIPSNLKLKGNIQKYLFKKSINSYLPKNVLSHPKQGFDVPFSLWFNNDLKEYVNDVLLSSNPLLSNYLDINYVKRIVEMDRNGMRDFSRKIWSLVFFEEWLKQNQT